MGWGRQLGLTPMRPLAFVAAKAGVAMVGGGRAGRADLRDRRRRPAPAATASDWVLAAVLVWLGSALFAVYGLAICLVFRGPNARRHRVRA